MNEIQYPHVCDVPGCEKSFPTAHGVTMHKTRAHRTPGVRRARAAAPANADELFEAVGKATEVLFPNGIPMARLIEIAEWQKATIKMLVRS